MEYSKLINADDLAQLIKNHKFQLERKGTRNERDYMPLVKLHIEGTDIMWLLTEFDPEEGIAFGGCQITCFELGYVSLAELMDVELGGFRVSQDRAFEPTMTLSQYADKARRNGSFLSL